MRLGHLRAPSWLSNGWLQSGLHKGFGLGARLTSWRIRTRIYLGFGAVIVLAAIVIVSGITQFSVIGKQVTRLLSSADTVTSNLEVTRLAEALRHTSLEYKVTSDEKLVKVFADKTA